MRLLRAGRYVRLHGLHDLLVNKMFTHLRVASGYSFKYGTAHIDALVARAGEFGFSALALTDRNSMAGAIRFAQECESAGITPILGVNLAFLQPKYRIALLAQSGRLSSLYRLLTALNMNSDQPLLTYEILEKFSEYSRDLIILHGPESQLAASIGARRSSEALSILKSTHELFDRQVIET